MSTRPIPPCRATYLAPECSVGQRSGRRRSLPVIVLVLAAAFLVVCTVYSDGRVLSKSTHPELPCRAYPAPECSVGQRSSELGSASGGFSLVPVGSGVGYPRPGGYKKLLGGAGPCQGRGLAVPVYGLWEPLATGRQGGAPSGMGMRVFLGSEPGEGGGYEEGWVWGVAGVVRHNVLV